MSTPPSAFPALVAAEIAHTRAIYGKLHLAPGLTLLQDTVTALADVADDRAPSTLALLSELIRLGALAQQIAEDRLMAPVPQPADPALVAGSWRQDGEGQPYA